MHIFNNFVGLLLCPWSFARNVPHFHDDGCASLEEHNAIEPLIALPQDQYRLSKEPSVFSDASNLSRTNSDKLTHEVQNTFLESVPARPKLEQARDNVTAYQVQGWSGSGGFYIGVDITSPKMDTCKKIISKVQRLATGLHCTKEAGCSEAHTIAVESTYSVTNGFRLGATLTAGVGVEGVAHVEMSVTTESSYEAQWSRAQSTSDTYTFNLKNGEVCTPSMVHVDLECEVTAGTYQWDTWWVDNPGTLHLEGNWQRKPPGPYDLGRWCQDLWFDMKAIKQPAMARRWKPLLDDDHARGWLYMHATSDLNKYIDFSKTPVPRLNDDEIVIRRDEKDHDSKNKGWRCSRPTQNDEENTVRVPLQGESGELLGFIACI